MRTIFGTALAAAVILCGAAEARPVRHHHHGIHHAKIHRAAQVRRIRSTAPESQACAYIDDVHQVCGGVLESLLGRESNRGPVDAATRAGRLQARESYGGTILGGRPAECPHAFCGCEASLYLFGKIHPELNLAANWIKYFPRATPAPGMVAARSGHVMVLISQINVNVWLVHDGNSGGGLTREHARSIIGYIIVDPRSGRHRIARL